jgi:DNA-binding MltR family transcriptional regulator
VLYLVPSDPPQSPEAAGSSISALGEALLDKPLSSAAIRSFKEQFSLHTERGAALMSAASLDAKLVDVLKAHMINSSLKAMMFREGGPLGSFSTRIRLAYLLGIISKPVYHELEIVREIRNKFAHRLDVFDFSHQEIKEQCDKLIIVRSFLAIPEEQRPNLLGIIFYGFDLGQDPFMFIATTIMLELVLQMENSIVHPIRSPTLFLGQHSQE